MDRTCYSSSQDAYRWFFSPNLICCWSLCRKVLIVITYKFVLLSPLTAKSKTKRCHFDNSCPIPTIKNSLFIVLSLAAALLLSRSVFIGLKVWTYPPWLCEHGHSHVLISRALQVCLWLIEWSINWSYVPFKWLKWCFTVPSSWLKNSSWISLDRSGRSFERSECGMVGAHNSSSNCSSNRNKRESLTALHIE